MPYRIGKGCFDLFVRGALAILVIILASCTPGHAQSGTSYDRLIETGRSQLQAGDSSGALVTGNQAIKASPTRWEAYALAGGALMNLKRYEEAADQFSEGIRLAPEAKKVQLRDLRRQCVIAETSVVPSTSSTGQSAGAAPAPATTQAEVVLWKSIENSKAASDFQSYLNQYPSGTFAGLAHTHLDQIEAEDRAQRSEQAVQAAQAEKNREQQAATAKLSWETGLTFTDIWNHHAELKVSETGLTFTPSNGKGALSALCPDLSWDTKGSTNWVEVRIKSTGKKLALEPAGPGPYGPHTVQRDQFVDALNRYCKP